MIDIAAIKAGRVRVTVLSGFLGAGKTTLLNRMLRASQSSKVAVLVNDFGKINIDNELIVSRDDCQIDLAGGCICCSIQKDLFKAVIDQLKQEDKPEHIIVECSGVSDPTQVLNTLASAFLRFHLHVDGLWTVIDSSQVLQMDASYQELVRRQIEPANLLILNKVDLIDEPTLEEVRRFIRRLSPQAVMLETSKARVPLDLVLGFKELPALPGAGELDALEVHTENASGPSPGDAATSPAAAQPHDEHDLAFESWSFTCDQPLSKPAITRVMEHLDPDIIRAKGFVYWDEPDHPLVLVNRVGQWAHFETYFQEKDVPLKTRLVFIGKPGWTRRSAVESQLLACRA